MNDDRLGKVARRIRIRVDSPGYGLPTATIFEYTEWYERTGLLWRLDRYAYEFRPEPRPGRLAHHLHRPLGPHLHCVDPRRPNASRHFEDFQVVLEQAHQEFLALATAGEPISCAGLRSVRSQR